ncbi:hypothetical protein BpHYR1_009826 [Brachionus plicatilis]|uniref:Uncharacterized protein n=1 Tax=Brachionus plicatilis TaxID=10195 RepID=A0A3M7SXU5_BRAPC|nr:hypothetical protein BpHYR1_009826 [Brachionus plicatilis]
MNILYSCNKIDSCSHQLIYSQNFHSSSSYIGVFPLSKGYNSFSFSPTSVKKGQILKFQTSVPNHLLIDNSDDSLPSDYYYNGTTLVKINESINSRFLFNVITDTNFYKELIPVARTHSNLLNDTFQVFGLYAWFSGSNLELTRYYNVTNVRGLDIHCSDDIFDLLVNCSLIAFSRFIFENILIDYDNRTTQINFTGSQQNFYGTPMSTNVFTHKTNASFYLLLNSEIKINSSLVGFEFNAANSGEIIIKLFEFSVCGDKTSCGFYFSRNFDTQPTYSVVKRWTIFLEEGINKISLNSSFGLKKGWMFMLDAKSTASLYIDTNQTLGFNDYAVSSIKSGTVKQLGVIEPIDNLKYSRVQFNVITDTDYFYQIIPLSLQFEKSGYFNISANLNFSKHPTFQTILVSNNQFLDIFCGNSKKTFNNTINCTVIYASQFYKDSITFDGDIYNYTNDPISFFGSDLSQLDINELVTTDKIGYFILPNTEFKFDADLTGFEIIAAKIGEIRISVSRI